MGDDCVEDRSTDVALYERRYGLRVEVDGRAEGQFEYCSLLFGDGWPFPLSWPRTVFRYVSRNVREDFTQLAFELRNLPGKERILAWCSTHVRGPADAPEKVGDLAGSDCEPAWPDF
jgi:hypothetical protein